MRAATPTWPRRGNVSRRPNGAAPPPKSALRKLERAVDRDADSAASAAAQAEELRVVLAEVDGPPESAVLLRPVEASFTEQDFADLVAAVRARGEWLSATIDGRTRVAEVANAADRELAAARADRTAARHEADVVEKSFVAAREALRAARDPLVELGAPAVDDGDVPAGWQRLTAWAASAVEERRTALASLEAAAEAAGKEAVVAAEDLKTAEGNAEQRRKRASEAALAEQSASTALTTTRRRHGELVDTLDGAPSAEVVAEQLAKVTELEQAAKTADADLRTARAAAKQAAEAQARIAEQVAAERQRLSRARDPLVGLGAPPIDGDSLLGAWTALTDWAAGQANEHRDRLAAATTAEGEAAEGLRVAERAVADDVTAFGIELPEGPVRDRVPVAVAAARARAEGDHTEMKRRVARVAGLHGDITAAESEAQVARLLADLLRSDKFPRWLIAGALDTLVAEASASLLELSGGQFELTARQGRLPGGGPQRGRRPPPGEDAVRRGDVPGVAFAGPRAVVPARGDGGGRRDQARVDLPRRGLRDAGRGDPRRRGVHFGEPGGHRVPDGRGDHARAGARRARAGAVPGHPRRHRLAHHAGRAHDRRGRDELQRRLWDPGYGSSMEAEELARSGGRGRARRRGAGGRMGADRPVAGVAAPEAVLFVDGVRRIDARVWIDDAGRRTNSASIGLCASYAAGVVCCCAGRAHVVGARRPARAVHGRLATPTASRRRRGCTRRSARRPRTTSRWRWCCRPRCRSSWPQTELKTAMEARRGDRRATSASDLLVVDGPLSGRAHLPGPSGSSRATRRRTCRAS